MKKFLIQLKIELKLHLREPEAIFWGFVFPVIMIVVLGFIFSKKDEIKQRYAVAASSAVFSHPLKKVMEDELGYDFVRLPKDSIVKAIHSEKYIFGLYSDSLNGLTFIYGTFNIAEKDKQLPLILNIINRRNDEVVNDKNYLKFKELEIKTETLKGDDVSYISWLIPGVIALNLFLSCIFGIGISIVQDKIKGKLKKIATTPLPKLNFILVNSIQRMIMLFLQVVVIVYAGYLFFDTFVVGRLADLIIALALSMLSFMIFGFAIAAVSKTIEKAVALSNLFFLFAIVISGAYFPNTGLPEFMKMFADLLPITMAVNLIRGIYAFGDSLFTHINLIIGLSAWVLFSLVIAIKLFKWHPD